MASTIFIDGKDGTTGLRIYDRLAQRQDVTLLTLPEAERKLPEARRAAIHQADVAILCLPDAAARESVALAEGSACRILDTSTAHRTAEGWAYGFPELSHGHREAIVHGRYVAVPGCHASGFIALVSPLVRCGLLPPQSALACFSLTGYSGGGKKMIAQYEAAERATALVSPRQYGLTQQHKHLPEMRHVCGLQAEPIFAPVVADFYSGMEVTVPLFRHQLRCGEHPLKEVRDALRQHYFGSNVIKVWTEEDNALSGGFIAANALSGRDSMELMVLGNDERLQLVARFDNLGKGSSGAALQCLNLMLGAEETMGLQLS